jgi:hypothetical protein
MIKFSISKVVKFKCLSKVTVVYYVLKYSSRHGLAVRQPAPGAS